MTDEKRQRLRENNKRYYDRNKEKRLKQIRECRQRKIIKTKIENLKNEEWKDIEGWENKYQVSNMGRIKSVERQVEVYSPKKNGTFIKTFYEKLLKPRRSSNNYQNITLYKDGKTYCYTIHRLVANAFIPNINNLEEINHMDGDKTNNSIYNLEWISHEDNIKHAIENGLIKKKADDKNDN